MDNSNNKFITIVVLLILALLFLGLLVWNSHSKVEHTKKEISKLQHQKHQRDVHNNKVDQKQKKIDDKIGNKDTNEHAKDFNKKFFDWSSWGEFSRNMESLRKQYPHIDDGDIVNISGKNVGNGKSPESTYNETQLPTDKKGQIAEVITQDKTDENDTLRLTWFQISDYKDGKFDITYMKPYEAVDYSNDAGSD